MLQKKLTIINKLGLHARASMKFSDEAMRFHSRCLIGFNGRQADAKSIMEIMVVGASCGSEIELIVDGDDEERALAALEAMINDRFGEAE